MFRASVQNWPEVVECHALTGDMDYLLRVVVMDMAHYSRFVLDTLLKHLDEVPEKLRGTVRNSGG